MLSLLTYFGTRYADRIYIVARSDKFSEKKVRDFSFAEIVLVWLALLTCRTRQVCRKVIEVQVSSPMIFREISIIPARCRTSLSRHRIE